MRGEIYPFLEELSFTNIAVAWSGAQVRRTFQNALDQSDGWGTVRRTRVKAYLSRAQCGPYYGAPVTERAHIAGDCGRCDAPIHFSHLWVMVSHRVEGDRLVCNAKSGRGDAVGDMAPNLRHPLCALSLGKWAASAYNLTRAISPTIHSRLFVSTKGNLHAISTTWQFWLARLGHWPGH